MRYFSRLSNGSTTWLIVALTLSVIGAAAHPQSAERDVPPPQLIRLNLLVLDGSERSVSDVSLEELRVFEDDVEQKVTFFSKNEAPLSYGLVIDNSGSLRSQFEDLIGANKRIVNANGPLDETFVMRFVSTDKIQIVQDFTSSQSALERSIEELHPEGGQTALVDAVYAAANHLIQRKMEGSGPQRPRALVLMTDGEDRQSKFNSETLFNLLRASDVQVFVIGLVSQLDSESRGIFTKRATRKQATELLDRLAKETGGRVFYPRSKQELSANVDDIVRDLRTQYLIGYSPEANPKSKPFRKVKIEIVPSKAREKHTVVARPGYTAPVRVTASGGK